MAQTVGDRAPKLIAAGFQGFVGAKLVRRLGNVSAAIGDGNVAHSVNSVDIELISATVLEFAEVFDGPFSANAFLLLDNGEKRRVDIRREMLRVAADINGANRTGDGRCVSFRRPTLR